MGKLALTCAPNTDHSHVGPLAAFLRIPIPWLRSTTYAFYPDETHPEIRRVFTPWHAPHIKRHFCGFCGTPLTYWSEESREVAETVSVNLDSLQSASLAILAEIGVLPSVIPDEEVPTSKRNDAPMAQVAQGTEVRGQPWFEEMLEGSELGRWRRRRGGKTSADGRTKVEWEIVEYDGNDDRDMLEGGIGTGKRKHGELVGGEDIVMRGGH